MKPTQKQLAGMVGVALQKHRKTNQASSSLPDEAWFAELWSRSRNWTEQWFSQDESMKERGCTMNNSLKSRKWPLYNFPFSVSPNFTRTNRFIPWSYDLQLTMFTSFSIPSCATEKYWFLYSQSMESTTSLLVVILFLYCIRTLWNPPVRTIETLES